MNILVVTGYNPACNKDGNGMRVRALLKELVHQGHTVSLLSYVIPFRKQNVTIQAVRHYIYPIRWELLIIGAILRLLLKFPALQIASCIMPPFTGFGRIVGEIIAKDKIDLIQCENAYTLRQIKRYSGQIPCVVDLMDVFYDRYSQALKELNVSRFIRLKFLNWICRMETECLYLADACVCVSQDDLNRFVQLGGDPRKMQVVPNGVYTELFLPGPKSESLIQKYSICPESPVLLFAGSSMLQNTLAVEDIFHDILPPLLTKYPKLRLIIAGTVCDYVRKTGLNLAYVNNVVLAGYVETMREYYNLADIVLLPIRVGSGTKLKVAEALAAGKPAIATSFAVKGYSLAGNEIIIEDVISRFPLHISELLSDPLKRESVGALARQCSLQYDWEQLMKAYSDIYEKVSQTKVYAS